MDEIFGREITRVSLGNHSKFMSNWDPAKSQREERKKKLTKMINRQQQIDDYLYDKQGVHLASGKDICDCLEENCPGCWLPCKRCKSTKCSFECRNRRRFVVLEVKDEEAEDEENDNREKNIRKWKYEIEPKIHFK